MKAWFMVIYIFFIIFSLSATADNSVILQRRLNQINSFQAIFRQYITRSEGETIQEGAGELYVQSPNKFNWHMFSPDENILNSDGKTLWFYSPMIEQATAIWLKDAINNTPLIFISGSNIIKWQLYNVKQEGDNFFVEPKSTDTNLKHFVIKITSKGIIKSFTSIDEDGQRSCYQFLIRDKNRIIDASKFKFKLPKNVTLEDRRY